jgi:hypothetical protein
VIVFAVIFTSNINAGEFEEKKFDIGVAPGILFGGDVYISLYDGYVRQNATFLIRTFADFYAIPQLSIGGFFNYTTLNLEKDIEVFDYTIKKSGTPIWEIGGAFKVRFILSDQFALKPGFGIGHRQFAGDEDFSTWKGLAMDGSCELQYILSDKLNLITEIGFLYQSYGGNEDTDVTFDPMFYWVFGVSL